MVVQNQAVSELGLFCKLWIIKALSSMTDSLPGLSSMVVLGEDDKPRVNARRLESV